MWTISILLHRHQNFFFGKLVDTEFKVRDWSKRYNNPSGMLPITLADKVTKLKQSLLEGAVMIQLRDSIEYNMSIVDGFYFRSHLPSHLFYIWKTE